jgi:hypothetical protein
MKNRRVSLRLAALNVASVIGLSVAFANVAGAEDAPVHAQAAMASLSNTSQLPFIRPRNGPSASRIRLDLRTPDTIKAREPDASAAGDEASSLRIPFEKPKSPAEALVKRVQREGLPVARLWENNAALLSVGLNQKGQPGLWLIQKMH